MAGLNEKDMNRIDELIAELRKIGGVKEEVVAPEKAKKNKVAKTKKNKVAKKAATKSAPKKAATKKAAPKGRKLVTPDGGIPNLSAAAPKELRELEVKGVLNVEGSMSPYNKAIAGRGGSFKNVEDRVSENGSVVHVYERRPTQSRPNPDGVRLLVCTQEKWIKREA